MNPVGCAEEKSPIRKAPGRYRQIGFYFAALTVITGFGEPGGLVSLPILFTLKEQLGQPPQAIAVFEAIIFIPACFGFAFGLLRDRWRPFGLGDRGYLILAAPLVAVCYACLMIGPISYVKLLVAILITAVLFELLDTVIEALMTAVAQRHLMSGRLSALVEAVEVVPRVTAMLAGGWMASHISVQTTFAVAAGCALVMAGFAAWRPASVFEHELPRRELTRECTRGVASSWNYLLRHRPYLPAVLVLALYNFSPGWSTPLFYYFVDEVNITGSGFGAYKAVNFAATAAASVGYGLMCQRIALGRLLVWAVALNVFPALLLLVIGGLSSAIAAALVVGFVSGFGYVAFFDLLRRSCPRSLEGVGTAVGFSLFALAGSAGDLLGAWLYERGGFVAALVIDALATVLILPVLRYLPHSLAHSRDGSATDSSVGSGYLGQEE